ncbi:serine/threonine-protein kinase [Streptomyces sp. 4N509B]|uniref:serine/threonine-protein kinase n=1 Tax=Streptomyces sp. 4N509B TaxID=3457413 RepID=UPI003FD455AD
MLTSRYVLKEVIGTGRSGTVWLAHDTVLGQDVALKPQRVAGDREVAARRRFGEPRAMARFRDHPHVVTLFNVVTAPRDEDGGGDGEGEGEEAPWLIMEYVPGGGLDQQPLMSPERAAGVGAHVADALAALHEAGIVHCDVKPANIGLTRRGTAKLLDFGAAYRIGGGTETVTANGPNSYTPAYAAPELALGEVPRPASDVFCLGATLYALVTGSPPRGDRSRGEEDAEAEVTEPLDVFEKAQQGLVAMDAEAVGPLNRVLTAMLQRDPALRPSAVEARRLLAAIAERAERSGKRRWRWPMLAAVATGVAVPLGVTLTLTLVLGAGKGERMTLIGDPLTVDLCELHDLDALEGFGEVELDRDYGNFDRCDVIVRPSERTRIDVSIALHPGGTSEEGLPAETRGRVVIESRESEDDECARWLRPLDTADTLQLGVRVNDESEEGERLEGGSRRLCEVASSVADSLAAQLNEGPVPRRAQEYPQDSLARRSACGLLDVATLRDVVPGIGDRPERGVASWDCEWTDTVEGVSVTVHFDRDKAAQVRDNSEVSFTHGYATYREPEGNEEDSCTVRVVYREYPGQDSDRAVEMVRLFVEGPTSEYPTEELCAMASRLTDAAAARLPPR